MFKGEDQTSGTDAALLFVCLTALCFITLYIILLQWYFTPVAHVQPAKMFLHSDVIVFN